jgi:hypothetical protein
MGASMVPMLGFVGVVILFFVVTLFMRKGMAGKAAANFDNSVNAILAGVIPQGETVRLFSYGLDKLSQSEGDSGMFIKAGITNSTTGAYKYYKYFIVAITDTNIYFIPAKYEGTMTANLVQNMEIPVEMYNLQNIGREIGAVSAGGAMSLPSVDVKFMLPDGTSKEVQFYQNVEQWKQI